MRVPLNGLEPFNIKGFKPEIKKKLNSKKLDFHWHYNVITIFV